MSMHASYSGKTMLDMTTTEFEAACQKAVATRDGRGSVGFSTILEKKTGEFVMLYADEVSHQLLVKKSGKRYN